MKKKMNYYKTLVVTAVKFLSFSLILCNCFSHVSAQPAENAKKWNVLTEIYLLFPYMDGETGVGNRIALPVDASAGDIFNKLKFGGMLYVEVHNNKWAITSDILYMNLNQEVTESTLLHSGSVTAKEFVWEPAGLYRIASFLEIGAGGRLDNIQTGMDVRYNVLPAGTEEYTGSHSKTWFDPILIARLTADIKDKWLFQFRGDIGGFGIGSDLTWQLQAYAGYRFSKLIQLTAGYRILSIDYDKGVDTERFIYNVDTFGPVIRLGFNF
jgi:hypothetical protein